MKGVCLAVLLPFPALPTATHGPFICLFIKVHLEKFIHEGKWD